MLTDCYLHVFQPGFGIKIYLSPTRPRITKLDRECCFSSAYPFVRSGRERKSFFFPIFPVFPPGKGMPRKKSIFLSFAPISAKRIHRTKTTLLIQHSKIKAVAFLKPLDQIWPSTNQQKPHELEHCEQKMAPCMHVDECMCARPRLDTYWCTNDTPK